MFSRKLGVTAFLATLTLSCPMSVVTATDGSDPQPVYFSLMVSSAPTLDTTGVVSVVDQTLHLINNDTTTVLHGYSLQYSQLLDAQVRLVMSKLQGPPVNRKYLGPVRLGVHSLAFNISILGCARARGELPSGSYTKHLCLPRK